MITIERVANLPTGVWGRAMEDGKRIAWTLEQPWRDNKPFRSCIPAGQYVLTPFDGAKYKNTFAFYNPDLNVHIVNQEFGRYACVIHSANVVDELQGCVAFGKDLSVINGQWAITNSKETTHMILEKIRQNVQHRINIVWQPEGANYK